MSTLLAEADRAFLLGVYESAVDFYQPRIERRTGVGLGKISVQDYAELARHKMRDYRRSLGPIRGFISRRRLWTLSQATETACAEHAPKCAATYYRGAIYVSLSMAVGHHEDGLALTTVHELSHALWERLAGEPFDVQQAGAAFDREKFRLLVEGFATYAERIWFLDVYPRCVKMIVPRIRDDPASVYGRGLKRVEELVKRFGPKILLEIPKRWRDL